MQTKRRTPVSIRKQVILVILMLFALVVVFAFIYDLHAIQRDDRTAPKLTSADELTSILLMDSLVTYHDPSGLFSLKVPQGWSAEKMVPVEQPFNVVFRSPNDFRLSVVATRLDRPKNLITLKKEIQGIQSRKGLNMNVRTVEFKDMDAIRRDVVLHYNKMMVLDFIKDGIAHEIQIEVPHRYDDEVYIIMEELFNGYEPVARPERSIAEETDSRG